MNTELIQCESSALYYIKKQHCTKRSPWHWVEMLSKVQKWFYKETKWKQSQRKLSKRELVRIFYHLNCLVFECKWMNFEYVFESLTGFPPIFACVLIEFKQPLTSSTSERTKKKHPTPVDKKHAMKNDTFNSMMYCIVAASKNPIGFVESNGYLLMNQYK